MAVTSRDRLKFPNYRKVWPLLRTSHQGAESYCLDVSRSSQGSAEGLKPGRELAGIREPSQRNQQSRKCLVSQEPCQRAGPQGRSQATDWRGGQDGKPNRRWGWARRRGVRDTSKGGQQGTGRAMGFAVQRRGCWAAACPLDLAPSFLIFKGVEALSRAHPGCILHDATHVPGLTSDPEKTAGDNEDQT